MIDEADRDHLRDMLRYAEDSTEWLGQLDAAELSADRRTLQAVFYSLLVIGEAAGRVSVATRVRLSAIPWTQVTGMRHHLAHGYDSIRTEIVVDTVRRDLPLITILRRALEESAE